jgi:hypothetical protein
MTRREDSTDLCKNCLNIDHCFYYRNQKEPIIFCDEFRCAAPSAFSIQLDGLDETHTTPLDKKNIGLCMNCKKMNSCNWDKNKIKFYCEEYE